jgi:type I restriction enzyme S subunit
MMVALGEYCNVVRGSSPRPKGDPRYYGPGVPRLLVADVTRDGKLVTPRIDSLTPEGAKKSRPMLKGDIVIAVSGNPGLPSILAEDACIHDGFVGLRQLNEELSADYVYRFLIAFHAEVKSTAVGTIFKNLTTDQIQELKIPLPPLAEQKRIAGILDAADALRAKRRESLAHLDTLLQSSFLTLFGDPVTNPNIPSAVMTDLVIKFIDYRGKSPEKSEAGIPLITAKIVKEKEVREPNEFIPQDSYDAWMRRGIPEPGDVIITTEAPMGEVALVPSYKAAFAQRLLILQPDRAKVESIYLMWSLTMPFVIRQMRQRSTGSTVTGIRSKEFKKVSLPIPPIALQRRFATIVESIERQKAHLRVHLAELDTLFASLQSRAFNGEL